MSAAPAAIGLKTELLNHAPALCQIWVTPLQAFDLLRTLKEELGI
jgi:hypothetical protein